LKVYISRDVTDGWVWVWIGPEKPHLLPNKDNIPVFTRKELNIDTCVPYPPESFKKKFNKEIEVGKMRRIELSDELVMNHDYRIFSNDKNRKQ
jgi:hypothetical protein